MNKLKKIISVLLLIIPGMRVNAQSVLPEPVDLMHSNGKIYVVVAVCLTILIGLFIYVFMVDKKISRFEKNRE